MIPAQVQQQTTRDSRHDPYYDLGDFHRPVSTRSKAAQIWFDRGLIWCYAFNHEEAAQCFERAIVNDPDCPMAYWGIAYAIGPYYNKPWDFFDEIELNATLERARGALADAQQRVGRAESVEKALIDALQVRYAPNAEGEDFSRWSQDYASAMSSVYQEFPDDLDVATLYAEALMNLTPWKMWDLRTGNPAPDARTLDAKQVLDTAMNLEGGSRHPGLLHLYIHLMEMSSAPEAALPAADKLRGLIPDAGHLQHMPSHIDILCGDYPRAVISNSDAIRADERFLGREGPVNFYSLYRSHNLHFLIYSAMFAGQMKPALQAVEKLDENLPETLLRVESPPMADWLESFISVRIHVLIRFGRWQDILALSLPQDQALYCMTTAMIHYGKAVAFAATGNIDDAAAEKYRFHDAVNRVPDSRTLFNNTCLDILAIAAAMLDGELEYRRGNVDLAFEQLRKAIALDDSLPYDEPWGWMQPSRHAYGALLLEQGHVEEAAAVYKADLGLDNTLPRALQHRNNVWALHGYHECLVKLGRMGEAAVIEDQLKQAVQLADVPIKASCFCRLEAFTGMGTSSCCEKGD
jgi:tetratricopeptide (TPR) repeat protein